MLLRQEKTLFSFRLSYMYFGILRLLDCNCIVTRGGIYHEILNVYPKSCYNTVILNYHFPCIGSS